MQFEIPRPDPVRLAARIRSREFDLVERIAARFEMEFGFARVPGNIELSSADGRVERLLPLAGQYDPSEFASLQTHARRVESLYAEDSGEPRARIDLVYVRRSQVVLATRTEAVHRIFLGQGVWGEVALERDPAAPSGYFLPNPWTEDSMKTEGALGFFAAIADRAEDAHGKGESPGGPEPMAL